MSTEGFDPSASGSSTEPDPMIGETLGDRYRITDRLGEGGMGEVYAAEHIYIQKRVALKLLRSEILSNEEAVKRFHQEARSASSIGHDNIISIEDFGKLPDGRIYLAMELLEGLPFNDMIKSVVPPERLLNILIQTGHGLAAAHRADIVHRDMKPENIYVTTGGDGSDIPKLLDFGIAKVSQSDGNNHLTRTGTIFGTPFYMAPEQALGQAVDHRVDIYAMGVIMYEVFCGAVPFEGESFMGILTQHITAEPKAPLQAAAERGKVIPPGLDAVIVRAMKKDPNERYQSMDALVQDLVTCYRQLIGPGMSTYMEAHQPPPRSATIAAPNPPPPGTPAPAPITGQVQAQPHGGQPFQTYPPTGQPRQPQPDAVPFRQPSATPFPPASASQSMVAPAKKGRGGLIALLVTILALGGGATAFFLLQNQGGDEELAEASAATGQASDERAKPTVAGDEGETHEGQVPPQVSDAAPAVVPSAPLDASAAAQPPADAAARPVEPPAEMKIVLVDSKPDGAKVFIDGEFKGTTPTNIKVAAGEPVVALLKKGGRRDSKVVIDGKAKKVVGVLQRKSRPRPDPKPEPRVDPCKANPNLPECMLE